MAPSLVETVAAEMEGELESWPDDAKLFMPYEVIQIIVPDYAKCLAARAFLNFYNIKYTVEMRWNAEWMSPSGKVPFLKCGKFLIPELELIAQHCEKRNVIPITASLKPSDLSEMRVYISSINAVLYNAELYICWVHDEIYKMDTSNRNGSVFPWPLSVIQNWSKRSKIIKQLKMFNWYNKTLDEVVEEVKKCCSTLVEKLGDKSYFFGDQPSELDALVFGHIFAIITTTLPNNILANVINQYTTLTDFTLRIEKKYFLKV